MTYYATTIDKIKSDDCTIFLSIVFLSFRLFPIICDQKLIIPKEYDFEPIDVAKTHTP